MPCLFSPRGQKVRFSTARLAAGLSRAYQDADLDLPRSRTDIHAHVTRIVARMRAAYGDADHLVWPRAAFLQAIADDLQDHAPYGAAVAWMHRHPSEGRLASTAHDPVWSYPALAGHHRVAARRSDWLRWWRTLALEASGPLDPSAMERLLMQQDAGRHQTMAAWWSDAIARLIEAMEKDPRMARLLAALDRRRRLAGVVGVSWAAGLPATPDWPDAEALRAAWRTGLTDYLVRTVAADPASASVLAATLDPDNDRFLSLDGLLTFLDWSGTAADTDPPPIVWSWAAAACAHHGARAAEVLRALTERRLMPGGAWFRARGPQHDDQAVVLHDTFDSIQDGLFRAIGETRWSGTMTLDWRRVRARGSLVAGQRPAAGVPAFLHALDAHLQAQGRQAFDLRGVVSCVLPLCHPDVPGLIEADTDTRRWRATLAIPHRFMVALLHHADFHLLDPDVFPDGLDAPDVTTIRAWIADRDPRRRHHRVVPATRAWGWVLHAIERGWNVVFPDPAAPVSAAFGLDGYGRFQIGADGAARWRSLAVNVHRWMGPEGVLDSRHLQRTARAAVAALSPWPDDTASPTVVLGYVGWAEALQDVVPADRPAWIHRALSGWHEALARAGLPMAPVQRAEDAAAAQRAARGGALAPQALHGLDPATHLPTWQADCVQSVCAPFLGHAALLGVGDGLAQGRRPPLSGRYEGIDISSVPDAVTLDWADGAPPAARTHPWRQQSPTAALDWEGRLQLATAARWWCPHGAGVMLDPGPADHIARCVQQAWLAGVTSIHAALAPGVDKP